jgi:predicted lipoprotein with Yx(FWY)xxD motif
MRAKKENSMIFDSLRKVRIRIGGAAAVAAIALVVAACGGSQSSSSASSAPGNAPAAPATGNAVSVGTANGSAGMYLVGASGRPLYLWVADSHGKSVCAGACAQAWPPLTTKATPVAASGVTMSQLSTINRSGGVKQVAYDGHPLYYFAGDTSKGSLTGQGSDEFGAKWWLVAPTGTAITKSAAAKPAAASSSRSSVY